MAAREQEYGTYVDQTYIAQRLKLCMRDTRNANSLPPYMWESLDMIASKLARILNGNARNIDSWHDIAGYATLVETELKK